MVVSPIKRVAIFVAAFVLILMATMTYWRWGRDWLAEDTGQSLAGTYHFAEGRVVSEGDVPFLSRVDREISLIAQRVIPSVVAIRSQGLTEVNAFDIDKKKISRSYFEMDSYGSGVVVTKEGHVITNYHVIEGMREIHLTLHDNKKCYAEFVGANIAMDLAVLKIASRDVVPPLPLGDSKEVKMGQMVLSFGNAYSMGVGMTQGVVSSPSTYFNNSSVFRIQTDAAIHPGHSGGPLVNVYGEIVGINTSRYMENRYSGQEGVPNLGFAIPSNKVLGAFEKICLYPHWIFDNMGMQLASDLSISDAELRAYLRCGHEGIIIDRIASNSVAERLGIKKGDILVKCNGRPINNEEDLKQEMQRMALDQTILVSLKRGWRGGADMAVFDNGEMMPLMTITRKLTIKPVLSGNTHTIRVHDIGFMGIRLASMSVTEEVQHNATGFFVRMIVPGSPLSEHLQTNDVIESLNGVPLLEDSDLSEKNLCSILARDPTRIKIAFKRAGKSHSFVLYRGKFDKE